MSTLLHLCFALARMDCFTLSVYFNNRNNYMVAITLFCDKPITDQKRLLQLPKGS